MQCVVLAGGMGTRMSPITNTIPKALIPIDNRPFIDYQLDYLSKQGITNVIICCGYLHSMIQNYVKDGRKWNLSVQYTIEDQLKGTGGALKLALDQNKLNDHFFVMYGDSFLPINFKEINDYFIKNNHQALMTIYYNNNRYDKSNVMKLFKDNILYDKYYTMHSQDRYTFIDYGLSIMKKSIIELYIKSEEKHDLTKLFHDLSLESLLTGYEVHHRFFEIGSFEGLKEFSEYINAPNYT
jgi:NDP-sugar pyrophosphorylase family protein